MKVVFVHLLNNFSGSPNVLSVVVRGLSARGHQLKLVTSRSEGFLSAISGVEYQYICYKWFKNNRLLTLLFFILAQLELFCKLFFDRKKDQIYYINTVTPVGAILACKLTGKNYYIHVHENMLQKKSFFTLYRLVYRFCNGKSIFVSKYVSEQALQVKDSVIAYNGLSDDFLKRALEHTISLAQRKTILMLCSLRAHKGIYEFIALAENMSQYPFEMVVSDSPEVVSRFMASNSIPPNLNLYSSQTDVHPYYQRARIVLNLSRPDAWVETFGLTLLEAFTYGIPAIGPKVGGPIEIIDNEINGFVLDSRELDLLQEKIQLLMMNDELYLRMSKAAQLKSQAFSSKTMIDIIEKYLDRS